MNSQQCVIFADFDETIIDIATYEISPSLSRFLHAHTVPLVLVTSRNWHGISPFSDTLNLALPQILENGASIVDPFSRLILYSHPIPADALALLRKLVATDAVRIVVSTIWETEEGDFNPSRIDIHRITVHLPSMCVNEIREEASRIPGTSVTPPQPGDTKELSWFDVSAKDVSKKSGIEAWLALFGVTIREIIVVGNSTTDMAMFAATKSNAAVTKVAVANAAPLLKKIADVIIPPANEDGFFQYLGKTIDSVPPSPASVPRIR